jgi:hypothetical protein
LKKNLIIIILIAICVASVPLAWALFPWAQSISATEMTDGTLVSLSPEDGTWIVTTGAILAASSLLAAIAVGVFYKPVSSKGNT